MSNDVPGTSSDGLEFAKEPPQCESVGLQCRPERTCLVSCAKRAAVFALAICLV
jgi:hypothetical protein